MQPVLCMITAAGNREDDASLVARARAAARAGVHLIHVRQPEREARLLIALVQQMVAASAGTRARVIVNDRVDVALAGGAHGVHLREDSMPAPRVRQMVPPRFLIGRSVHAADAAARSEEAGGLDYLVFGTVFPTASKPGASVAGLDGLREACLATRLPVLAVGGMSAERVGSAMEAGAAGVAAIGLFADPPIEGLARTVERVRSMFDTPRTLP